MPERPTHRRVLAAGFATVEHLVPMLSLDNAYKTTRNCELLMRVRGEQASETHPPLTSPN